jgi:ornithine carbamoyltransferase
VTVIEDPDDGLGGVDLVHTDVWVSMGEPKEAWQERTRLLGPIRSTARR